MTKKHLTSFFLSALLVASGPASAFSTVGLLAAGLAAAAVHKVTHARANHPADGGPAYVSEAIGSGSNDFSACKQHFPQGRAVNPGLSDTRQVCFDEFAVLHSASTKSPVFVAERLNAVKLHSAMSEKRTNVFYEEARLPSSYRARLADFSRSGYDRGHMAPAGDMPNAQAMAQSFSLANMIPQNPENNRGVWADIEKATRQFAKRSSGNVYVFTGPHYEGSVAHIGTSHIPVPSHIWKVVYDESGHRAWAYWLPNTSTASIKRITYQEYRALGGMDVLRGVPIGG